MNKRHASEQVLLGEVQLLLAEKRTYFSILRTGLAIVAVPMTIIGFLIATAPYHKIFQFRIIGSSVIFILLLTSVAGVFLTYRSGRKIKMIDREIIAIEKSNKRVDKIVV